MASVARLLDDEELPPESGVRRVAIERHPDIAAEVAEEVFFDVLELWGRLSPLQGAWLTLGARTVGGAVLSAAHWQAQDARTWRERWPELVPGYTALDTLAELMVDRLCG